MNQLAVPATIRTMELRLLRESLDEIDRHAVAAYPDECCGIVLEVAGRQVVRRITNVQNRLHAKDPARHPRDARIAYYMEPKELGEALRLAERPGNRLRAFYHSHPDHDAYFSDEDRAAATPLGEPSYPDAAYVVVSVVGGRVARRIAVAWEAERSRYVEVPLVCVPEPGDR